VRCLTSRMTRERCRRSRRRRAHPARGTKGAAHVRIEVGPNGRKDRDECPHTSRARQGKEKVKAGGVSQSREDSKKERGEVKWKPVKERQVPFGGEQPDHKKGEENLTLRLGI